MSKVSSRLKNLRKAAEKVVHSNKIRALIPACMASAGPPLGPTLGQVILCFSEISVSQFLKPR